MLFEKSLNTEGDMSCKIESLTCLNFVACICYSVSHNALLYIFVYDKA